MLVICNLRIKASDVKRCRSCIAKAHFKHGNRPNPNRSLLLYDYMYMCFFILSTLLNSTGWKSFERQQKNPIFTASFTHHYEQWPEKRLQGSGPCCPPLLPCSRTIRGQRMGVRVRQGDYTHTCSHSLVPISLA